MQVDKLRQLLIDLMGKPKSCLTSPSMSSTNVTVGSQASPVGLLADESLSMSSTQMNRETLTKGLEDADPSLVDSCSQAIVTNVPLRETHLLNDPSWIAALSW